MVPVLNDPYDNHDELVSLVLSNVRTTEAVGQAILGTASTTNLTIHDIDPNFNPLVVSSLQWTATAHGVTQIFVTFSKPLNTSSAINPANYALVNVGPDGKYGTRDDLGVATSVAMYQSSRQVVVLTPAQPLRADQFYHLWINGGTAGGVEDVGDNILAGNGSTASTSYTAMLASGTTLKYDTPAGDRVSLKSTAGFLEDLLSGTGQGEELTVVSEVPHHTVLSGSVKKVKGGTGRAYLGYTIWGLGNFGDVRVKLKTPPFQIGQYPFSRGSTVPKASSSPAVKPRAATRDRSLRVAKTMKRPFHSLHH